MLIASIDPRTRDCITKEPTPNCIPIARNTFRITLRTTPNGRSGVYSVFSVPDPFAGRLLSAGLKVTCSNSLANSFLVVMLLYLLRRYHE